MDLEQNSGEITEIGEGRRRRRSRPHSAGSGAERLYWNVDLASEYLLYAVLIFTPWAFGTTETWSTETVNALNYVLGALLAIKIGIRKFGGFAPDRWDDDDSTAGRWVTRTLFALTVLVLGYCVIHFVNARGEFVMARRNFNYFDDFNKAWPHSYDRKSSIEAFQLYLASACFFWGLRDWLITKTLGDEVEGRRFSTRLKRLLWVICINASALALQGTLQRLSHTGYLLWMVRPHYNTTAIAQFGPFNYRSNGAQYLNLIWPVAVGFWYSLHLKRGGRMGSTAEPMLFPIAAIILAAAILANSRGGIAVAVGEALALIAIFAYAFRNSEWWKTAVVSVIFAGIIAIIGAWQWPAINARLNENSFNTMSGRTEIYQNTERILEDFPLWGSGPGTFGPVYLLYRENPYQTWFAMAHNDFLQTRATFGSVGLFAILAMLVLTLAHSFLNRGAGVSWILTASIWTALFGCLAHAKFDFPLQIYSILLLFLAQCAILTTTSSQK